MCAIFSCMLPGCADLTRPQTAASQDTSQAANAGPPAMQRFEPPETQASDDLVALVAYSNWLRDSNPAQLQRVLADAEARAKDPGGAVDKMRLAVILSLPQAPFRNDARASALIEHLLNDPRTDTNVAMFAYMLRWDLQDRHRLQADYERSLTQERQQRATLKQKLNELKAIEEQIHRREVVNPN